MDLCGETLYLRFVPGTAAAVSADRSAPNQPFFYLLPLLLPCSIRTTLDMLRPIICTISQAQKVQHPFRTMSKLSVHHGIQKHVLTTLFSSFSLSSKHKKKSGRIKLFGVFSSSWKTYNSVNERTPDHKFFDPNYELHFGVVLRIVSSCRNSLYHIPSSRPSAPTR